MASSPASNPGIEQEPPSRALPGALEAALWSALREARQPPTLEQLQNRSRSTLEPVRHRINRWRKAGYVDLQPGLPTRFEIAREYRGHEAPPHPGAPGPKNGTPLADDVWRALRRFDRAVTFEEILAATSSPRASVFCRLHRWARRGVLKRIPAEPPRFALTPAAPLTPTPPAVTLDGEVAPPQPNGRARMWKAMRILKAFDIPTLMMTAEVSRRSCDDFLYLLSRARYVRIRRPQPNGWASYALICDTGPKHPTFTRCQHRATSEDRLLDQNTGASVELIASLKAKEAIRGL